jgi:hypothetical protein
MIQLPNKPLTLTLSHPMGEGTVFGNLLFFERASNKLQLTTPWQTAKDSPSPGGEGRGEGEPTYN